MAAFGRSARPKLIEPAGFASAARAELAVAIAKRTTAQAHLAQIEASASDFWSRRLKAERDVEAAQAAVDAAKTEEVTHLINGTSGAPDVSAARATLAAAQDRLDILRRAQDASPAQEAAAREAIAEAVSGIKKAVLPVLREHPSVSGILDRVESLEREYLASLGALNFLVNCNAVLNMNDWGGNLNDWQSKRARDASTRTILPPDNWSFANRPEPGPHASQTWIKAGDLLKAGAAPWFEAGFP